MRYVRMLAHGGVAEGATRFTLTDERMLAHGGVAAGERRKAKSRGRTLQRG